MSEPSTVTLEDFEGLQAQLLQMKTENYNLRDQVEAAKKRSSLTPQQIAENLRVENLQIRVRLNQCVKEKEQLTDQLKLVKIAQFLQLQNLYEATSIPDINTIPQQLRPLASEVFQLMDDVKKQIVRRAFVDTELSELGKRSKTLSRVGEQLQAQIDAMRADQTRELGLIDTAREQMQRLESETTTLRNELQAVVAPKSKSVNPDDLKAIARRSRAVEAEIAERKAKHAALMEDLSAKIASYDRKLDDAQSAKAVMEKKTQQKIWALQAEINRRRGIVVHSSNTTSRKDSAELFLESKRLIAQIAQKQQEVWELEERVSFSRNSVAILASDIVKKLLAKATPEKFKEMAPAAQKAIVQLAQLDRKTNELRKSAGK